MPSPQGRYWLGTLYEWNVPGELPEGVAWLKGQEEECPTTLRRHHQIIAAFKRSVRRSFVVSVVGQGHWELTRSSAAEQYVHKEATAVAGTRFELGSKPFKRNSNHDWDEIKQLAKSGDLEAIPSDIYIRYYSSLTKIAATYAIPLALERDVFVFWGKTGTGKSRRAWEEAGLDAYSKDPRTKWWCGYRGQENIVIDEFRGDVGISHMLRWLDRYPVMVETKGGSRPLNAKKIWITSNLDPRLWYVDIDSDTIAALIRRLNITHYNYFFT